MNVICLGFIAYHFLDHPPEPKATPIGPPTASKDIGTSAPLPERVMVVDRQSRSGNIELVRAPKIILGIASHVDGVDGIPAERAEEGEATMPIKAAHSAVVGPLDPNATSKYWVQLGALSKEATARRYWLRLKARYSALLYDQEPRYLEPAEIGGSLHHIRIGPMAGDAAAGLCKQLQAEGADCFRIKSSNQPPQ